MAKLKDLKVTIGLSKKGLSKLNGDLRRTKANFKRSFGEISAMATSVGKNMTAGITAPLTLFAANAIKTFASFEQSMAKVKAVSGATGDEFEMLENKAKQLGASTKFTASEVAGLMLEYSKLGFSSSEIEKVTGATLALAQATDSDLGTSAEVAGATLRAFGLDASETQRVVDVMAASFSSSALDMSSFADSMKFVAPVAKAAGVSLEEASSYLAVLANNGVKGSAAGTALRRILSEVAGTGEDFRTAIEKSATEVVNLADAKDEVGRSAQSAFLIIKEGLKDVDGLTVALENAEGASAKMAATMDNTTQGAFARMGSALEAVSISFGESFAPMANGVANAVASMAGAFSKLPGPARNVLGVLGLLTAAAGPLILIGPQLIAARSSFLLFTAAVKASRLAMIAMNPLFPLVLAGVAALATAYLLLNARTIKATKLNERLTKQLNKARSAYKGLTNELKGKASTESTENLKKRLAELDEQQKQNNTTLQVANTGADLYAKLNGEAADQINMVRSEVARNTKATTEHKQAVAADVKIQQERAIILQELQDRLDAVADSTEEVTDVMVEMGPAMEKVTEMNKGLMASDIMAASAANHKLKTSYIEVGEAVQVASDNSEQLAGVYNFMSGTIEAAFANIKDKSQGFHVYMKQMLVDLLKKALALLAAFAAMSVLFPGSKVVAGGLKKFMAGGMGIPQMADGGMFTGASLAMVGEGPGTSAINPEVVAPLDKLRNMMGGSNVTVTGRLDGRDILISNERANFDRNRVRGF